MQLFLALTKDQQDLVEDQQIIRNSKILIKGHLLRVLIHPQLESLDQEITVLDLMISPI